MKVYAQKLENPLLKENVRELEGVGFAQKVLPLLFHWLILVGFLGFVIYFLLGGFKWITSQGDKNKIEEAQKQLTYAFIGLFVVFSIFAVTKIIGKIMGIEGLESLQISLPTL